MRATKYCHVRQVGKRDVGGVHHLAGEKRAAVVLALAISDIRWRWTGQAAEVCLNAHAVDRRVRQPGVSVRACSSVSIDASKGPYYVSLLLRRQHFVARRSWSVHVT